MGLICGKPSAVEDSRESPPKRSSLTSSKRHSLKVPRLNSSKRDEGVRTKDRLDGGGGGGVKVMLIDKAINGSVRLFDDHTKSKKVETAEVAVLDHPGSRRIPKVTVAEQVAAGWPGWLSAAAAEAVNGWIPRRADTFQKLNKVCCVLYLIVDTKFFFSHIAYILYLVKRKTLKMEKTDLFNK